jgi:hypothetical protein
VSPFTGKATYDNFPIIGQDISSILLLMDVRETPLLSILSDPDQPALSIVHTYREERLVPDRITNSSAVNSVAVAAVSLFGVSLSFGDNAQVGMLLEPEVSTGAREVMQVASIIGANTIAVTRGINNVINSLAAGGEVFVISTAELEGSETSGDVTVPRTSRDNSTQIFKKPVTISGSDQSVITSPDVGSEFDHQTTLRTIECVKDLEKALIRGVRINSIGSESAYRSMNGLRAQLTAINSAIIAASFTADPLLYLNDQLQNVWNTGARDIDVIMCGATWKREISNTNASRLEVRQDERGIERRVEYIQTDFGEAQLVLSPYMPARSAMGLATRRVRVLPLRGRSFQREILAKTGDSFKGHVLGEYTNEVHHPDKMFYSYGG